MMELSDRELLDRFSKRRDDAAFRVLVERHLALVHGVARRVTGNEDLARDVAQNTFLRLARRAALIPADLSLAAWLHRVTHHLAIDLVRREDRRKKRELAAHDPAAMDSTPSPDWSALAPVIDPLINRLPAADRDVLLLRYYRNEPHAAVARQLGLSEAVAKKRAARALEKLRTLLARQGIATSVAVLATLLPAHATTPVSGSYVVAVAAAAKGTAPLAASGFNLHLAMTTAQKSAIAVAALIFMGSAGYALRSATVVPPSSSRTTEAGAARESRIRPSRNSPLSAEERLERLRQIVAIISPVERHRQMLAFVEELGPDQFGETAAQLEQLDFPEFKLLIGQWVKSNPLAAVAWAQGHASKETLPEVLLPWGEVDPAAALDWVTRHCPGATGSDDLARVPLIAVLAGTASKDMAAAVKGLEAIPVEKDRIAATKHLANQLLMLRFEMLETMLDVLRPAGGAQYSELLAWGLGSFLDGNRAVELLIADEGARKLKPLKEFFMQWQSNRPDEALAAISKVPEGPFRDEAVQGYCVAAVKGDARGSFALLQRYPGAATDAVLAEMSQRSGGVGAGLDQLFGIKDPALRDEVMTKQLKTWLKHNESAARQWMDAHELSPEVRAALQTPAEPLENR